MVMGRLASRTICTNSLGSESGCDRPVRRRRGSRLHRRWFGRRYRLGGRRLALAKARDLCLHLLQLRLQLLLALRQLFQLPLTRLVFAAQLFQFGLLLVNTLFEIVKRNDGMAHAWTELPG